MLWGKLLAGKTQHLAMRVPKTLCLETDPSQRRSLQEKGSRKELEPLPKLGPPLLLALEGYAFAVEQGSSGWAF